VLDGAPLLSSCLSPGLERAQDVCLPRRGAAVRGRRRGARPCPNAAPAAARAGVLAALHAPDLPDGACGDGAAAAAWAERLRLAQEALTLLRGLAAEPAAAAAVLEDLTASPAAARLCLVATSARPAAPPGLRCAPYIECAHKATHISHVLRLASASARRWRRAR